MSTPLSEEGLAKLENGALLDLWKNRTNFSDRNVLMKVLQKKGFFPTVYMQQWDKSVGAYPDYNDPEFLQRLLAKKEFEESFQSTWNVVDDPCAADTKFEITPVQRFSANLMSPRTPYMSALLYHGVGVGKTCSAIQISEAWLGEYPQEQVYIVAPATIQEGFRTTIFDTIGRRLMVGTGIEPNRGFGCTGDTYMELTGTLMERDAKEIQKRVSRAIQRRYRFFGYGQFSNYVKGLLKRVARLEGAEKEEAEREIIRKEFSNKLLIIDEAHNLREVLEKVSTKTVENENSDEPNGLTGQADMAAGKQLTPQLLKVLDYSYGMKLVLLTATPMYNSHLEIIFMLNLLLRNDKRAEITQSDIFDAKGDVKNANLLGSYASRYVSFMRGENPSSFPIRLKPKQLSSENKLSLEDYPEYSMKDRVIDKKEKEYVTHLPIVKILLPVDSENYKASKVFLNEQKKNTGSGQERGISSQELSISVQAGNFVPPVDASTFTDYRKHVSQGLQSVFDKISKPTVVYRPKKGTDAQWLLKDNLINYSPKFVFLLKRLASCEGVAFVYSRFIESGALPLALALEANGYKCYGRATGFLEGGAQDVLGGQCALCPRRKENHDEDVPGIAEHPFQQAYYGLLTGDPTITPDRNVIIKGEQKLENKEGAQLKVVIGSQIASEGVDLRYVREVHVLDSWYHLNKTEQVIGRAIRFCSHSALPEEKRNTTIYLYATDYPDEPNETADLYSYRLAFRKAKQMGQVSRILKAYAIDCNLNHDAIIIKGQAPIVQIDSQRLRRRDVNINDVGFTAICDWIETCDYECKPKKIAQSAMGSDDSTYSEFAARQRKEELRERMRGIFEDSVIVELAQMEGAFSDVPIIARADFFTSIIDNKLFQVTHKDMKGYIKFCNNYFVFQPFVYADINIPMAIRMGSFPVRRDFFDPIIIERQEISLVEEEPVPKSELSPLWTAFQDWTTALSTSKTWIKESGLISDYIKVLAKEDNKTELYLHMVVRMMRWFHTSVMKQEAPMSDAIQRTLLEFVWDNWFSLAEQRTLHDVSMLKDGEYMEKGGTPVFRFYNPDTDRLFYEYKETEAADTVRKAVQKVEATEQEDFRTMKEGGQFLTGIYYGFLIGKKGRLVFKTNSVPQKGKTWDRGHECGNNTNKTDKYTILEALGAQLKASDQPDLDLRPEIIRSVRVLNAAEACIVMELVMRYLDILRFNGLRWFYRPVYARILGHLGAPSPVETKPVTPSPPVETKSPVPPKSVPQTKPVTPSPPVETKPPVPPKSVPKQKTAFDLTNEEDEFVPPSTVPTRLTVEEFKRLSKAEIGKLTNAQFPKGLGQAAILAIIQKAPDKPPTSQLDTLLAQIEAKEKEEEEEDNPMFQLD